MRSAQLLWVNRKQPKPLGFVLISALFPWGQSFNACISSRITTVIQVGLCQDQVNYSCYNEPFAVSRLDRLYLDMHGLIFEISTSVQAGSTRYLIDTRQWVLYTRYTTRAPDSPWVKRRHIAYNTIITCQTLDSLARPSFFWAFHKLCSPRYCFDPRRNRYSKKHRRSGPGWKPS